MIMKRGRFRNLRFRWAVPGCTLLLAGYGILPAGLTPLDALSRKQVWTKVEPSELVAEDQSRCTVDFNRFNRIKVGDGVWCLWTPTVQAGWGDRS